MRTLLAILVFGLFLTACAQQTTEPVLSGPPVIEQTGPLLSLVSAGGTAGGEVKVDIVATDFADVGGAQLDISYDPEYLTYVSTAEGVFFNKAGTESTLFLDIIKSEPGKVRDLAVVRMQAPGISGSGVIASLTFTSLKSGTTQLGFSKVLIASSGGEAVPVESSALTLDLR